MKRIWLILLCVVAIFSCGNPKKKVRERSDFKVEDTGSINQVFLADKGNNTVLLTKESGNKWMVNNKYMARPDMIQNLLICLRRVEVKQYVPKPAIDNVIKSLAVNSTKVEIYQNGKLTKTYYVGGPTQDHYGTYMMMSGSDIPFICYMPGFRGYITNYYIPLEAEWKDRKIFAYDISEIASVKVEFVREPQSSWEIINRDDASFQLKSLHTGEMVENFDTNRVKAVLKNFKLMGFEGFADVNKVRMDSVKKKYALYRVSVNERSGKTRFVDLYQIPLPPGTMDMLGRPAAVDVDRMYGLVDGEVTTICQFYTFDPVTVPITELLYRNAP